MVTIKDIYQWVNFPPEPPSDLTPLQKIEWRERNSQMINDYNNKSFVGEFLVAGPALFSIEKNRIPAFSNYIQLSMDKAQQISLLEGGFFNYYELTINYEIFYDESLYETVKLIHDKGMIEFEGTILKFSHRKSPRVRLDHNSLNEFDIQLRLSNIKVIPYVQLYSNRLNDKHYFLPNNKSPEKSTCFIATAAYGNEDITEVIQLRDFRDNVLRNSVAGRCFISTYGVLSPPIALVIRQSNWLRKATRGFLKKVVLPMTKGRTK